MSRSLRIVVADDHADTRESYHLLLPALGHAVVGEAATGKELVERCCALRPDLVISDIKMPDMDGIEAAARIYRECPAAVILVTGHRDPELVERALASHALAYLVKPVRPEELAPAIALAVHRFAEFEAVRKEAEALRQSLEERKVIERAKGVIMRRLGVDEQDAYRRLKRCATDRNRKMSDYAREVLRAEEVFATLDGE
jgi:response regulator NasT